MGLTKPRAAQIYDIDYKQATRVVTVANITLASGAPSQVDGVNLSLNDRVLVTGQSTPAQNGIYLVATLGTGSNGTWTRTLDTDVSGELLSGTVVMVTEGVIYKDTQWKLTTDDPITIGSTPLTWVQNYSANSISSGNSNVTVLTNANVLISSAGTANVVDVYGTGVTITGTESVTGNITGANVNTGNISLSGNVVSSLNVTGNTNSGNLSTPGAISSTGNVTSGNVLTPGVVSATANITGGNILTAGIVSAVGNITGNYFLGNVFFANGITASKIYSGNSEVNVTASGGNVNVSVGGTGNVAVFSTAGEYVNGLLSATGNVTAGNVLTGGLVSAAGNITGGNILTAGVVSATGNITTAGYFLGNVACASGIYATKIFNGTSEANIGTANANLAISIDGTSNVAVFASTGEYVAGVVSATGNITGGNLLTAGIVSSTGNATAGNLLTSGQVSATGNVTAGNLTINSDAIISGNLSVVGNATLSGNILGDRIINGNTSIEIQTASGNANISVGGTSNVAVFTTAGLNLTGNLSATGNITGGNILGNGYNLSGINTFSTVSVANSSNIVANSISSTLTFAAGNNITLTTSNVTNTVTIAYSGTSGTSIFATGGDMGLVTEAVTSSEDLGSVIDAVSISYDLGQLGVQGVVSNDDIIAHTITGDKFANNITFTTTGNITAGNISATGNITGNMILGNGSQLTGIATGNACVSITNTNITANFTIGVGYNGLSVGPMNTANGVQVIVSPGQRWVII